MRMVEKDPAFATPIIREIIEGNLQVIELGEDVVMSPQAQDWVNESVNWSFAEHEKLRMGTTIWHELSENDNTNRHRHFWSQAVNIRLGKLPSDSNGTQMRGMSQSGWKEAEAAFCRGFMCTSVEPKRFYGILTYAINKFAQLELGVN